MSIRFRHLLAALLMGLSVLNVSAQTLPTHLDARQAAAWLKANPKAVVLDVRTPEEFRQGHLPNAVNVNYQATDFEQQLARLDKTRPYLVHCAVGGRSTRSLPVLEKLGFSRVYHLDGGLQRWQQAGLPVVQ
ncbi:rhodanese-like domain-containing protein [Spirosoma luteolum]